MNRRTKIIVSVAGIFIVALILLGLTYAYFLTRINGNTSDKSISVTTANLELTYGDGNGTIMATNIMPGTTLTDKTFTVTNNGNVTIDYIVDLENIVYTFSRQSDIKYTLTCTSSSGTCNGVNNKSLVTSDDLYAIVVNTIPKNVTHTYTLTLTYENADEDQSIDMGKELSAKINIKALEKNKEKTLQYAIINNAKNNVNGTQLMAQPLTIPAQETSAYEFIKVEDPSVTNFLSKPTEYYITYGDGYTVDKKTGKFTIVNPNTIKYSASVSASEIAGKYGYWSRNESRVKNTTDLGVIYKITTNESYITSDTLEYAIISSLSTEENTVSIESALSIAEDDYGISYYYRGEVDNNYLELNDMCFRVVRIEGDGSIKLILAKENKCSTITEEDEYTAVINNRAYATFGYEGYSGTDTLEMALNNWYNEKLKTVEEKLKNEAWCLGGKINKYNYNSGELLNSTDTDTTYWYETGKRLRGIGQEKIASYKCSDEAQKKMSYVGILHADEVAYAGGTNKNNSKYYLYENAKLDYWLLPYSDFSSSRDITFRMINSNGNFYGYLDRANVDARSSVRPAVTLASGVELASGDGTIGNPYTIKMD